MGLWVEAFTSNNLERDFMVVGIRERVVLLSCVSRVERKSHSIRVRAEYAPGGKGGVEETAARRQARSVPKCLAEIRNRELERTTGFRTF